MRAKLRPLQIATTVPVPLVVGDLMRLPAFFGAHVRFGAAGMGDQVRRVNVMQIPTAQFAGVDELVLTTSTTFEGADGDFRLLIEDLANRGVAALAAHSRALACLGAEAHDAAEHRELPLIELPEHARLNSVHRDVLARLVAEQTTQLEEDRRVREHFSEFALAGGGVEGMLSAVGELMGGDIAISSADGSILAARSDDAARRAEPVVNQWLERGLDEPASGGGWVVWPVRGARRRLGCIAAAVSEAVTPVHKAVLEHGAAGAAPAMLQVEAAAAERVRLRQQFLRDLLAGALEPDALSDRADLLGWNADVPYRVIVAGGEAADCGGLVQLVHDEVPDVLALRRDGSCVAIVGEVGAANGGGPEATAGRLAGELARQQGVRVGVSSEQAGVSRLRRALQEAQEMLGVAQSFPRSPVRWFERMDPLRVLALVPAAELTAFSNDTLASLDALETERRDILLKTLEVLIGNDLNAAATARAGGWHYNTVRYRIGQLTELLGPFVESGEDLQSLTLALLIRRELDLATPRYRAGHTSA